MSKKVRIGTKPGRADDSEQGEGCEPSEARSGNGGVGRGYSAQPKSGRDFGHRRHSASVLEVTKPSGDGGVRRHLAISDEKQKVETTQVMSQRSRRMPNSKLHIDDGCMGGGTSIPHEDPITHETNYLSMDGEHSLKDTYFDRLGQHVFFYCIQCHRMKTEDWGGVHYESSWGGRGGGGMFIQCQDAIGSNTVHLAHNFMHELGNCIGLSGKTYWDDAKQEWIYLCTGNCAMNPNTKEAVDYCSDCWTDIDLAGATRL